ncbi:hypothetical protein EYS42_05010 [Aquabacterium lacunae]|uniref:Uncharacterized protein n=1 Tax=Aquabacterium lacunae TaxID=2528630 RepID=A0A4Q9H1V8_9BURK|nr:hypothetical protein [Aquabacterium lacunae]TBO32551.1 hypothetical protein EYS42_05010 [Aquabacterium lacunae]
MQLYTRETLLERLMLVPDLIGLYQAQDASFAPAVLQWMTATEDLLKRLRSPLVSMCSGQRARLLAAVDGVHADAAAAGSSPRKASRAAAALCLTQVEAALRHRVQELDTQLQVNAEKMAQLVALGAAVKPLPVAPQTIDPSWLQLVWQQLAAVPETRHLHGYLSALMAPADRHALLEDAVLNWHHGQQV